MIRALQRYFGYQSKKDKEIAHLRKEVDHFQKVNEALYIRLMDIQTQLQTVCEPELYMELYNEQINKILERNLHD